MPSQAKECIPVEFVHDEYKCSDNSSAKEWNPIEFVEDDSKCSANSSDHDTSSSLRITSHSASSLSVAVFPEENFVTAADEYRHPSTCTVTEFNFLGRHITFEELKQATNGFNTKNKVSQYEYSVFTGSHSKLGKIAVCSFLKSDELLKKYLERMVRSVSRVDRAHPNVASPIGYCIGDQDFHIVYDFEFKCNLADFLKSDGIVSSVLLKIVLDVAKGMRYITNAESCFKLPKLKPEIIWLRERGSAVIVHFVGNDMVDIPTLIRDFADLMRHLITPLGAAEFCGDGLVVYRNLAALCGNQDSSLQPSCDGIVEELQKIVAGAF